MVKILRGERNVNFKEKCKAWLVDGFSNKQLLGGTSMYRGEVYCHDHILKDPGTIGELLLPGVDPTVLTARGFKPHRDAHHLNSSQMFCVNLFQPLRADSRMLKKMLRQWGISLNGQIDWSCFEHVANRAESTNFDFTLKTDLNERVYVEVKYTEPGFGKLTKPTEKRARFYEEWLSDSMHGAKLKPWNKFVRNYQLFRNVSYIKSKTDYVVFLFPFAQGALRKQASIVEGFENVRLIDSMRMHVYADAIDEFDKCGLKKYYREFNKHYFGWVQEGAKVSS